MEAPTCIIVANGDVSRSDLSRIDPTTVTVVACDGAVWACLDHGTSPHAVVGDLDSINEPGRKEVLPSDVQVIHMPDQSTTDLAKAMAWADAEGHRSLLVLGATGGDLQHEWGNMLACAASSLDICVVDSRGTRQFLSRGTHHRLFVGHRASCSLMAVHDVGGLTLTGAEFELDHATLRTGSQGVHNVACDDSVSLSYATGRLALVTDSIAFFPPEDADGA